MAESEKIKSTDIIQKDIFKNTVKSTEELTVALDELEEGFLSILETQQKILNQSAKNNKQIKEQNEALRKAEAARKGLAAVQKTQLELDLKEEKLKQEKIKTQKLANAESEKAAKAAKKQAKEVADLNSAYKQGVVRLSELKKTLKELEFTGRTNGKVYKALREEFTQLDKKVRGAEESVKEFQRGVGDYSNSIKDAIGDSGLFSEQISKLSSLFELLKNKQDGAADSTSKLGFAAKGAGILVLLTLLKGTSDFATKTAQGANLVERATTGAATGVSVYANSVASAAAASISGAIASVKLSLGIGNQTEALADLVESQIDYINNTTNVTQKTIDAVKANDAYVISLQKHRVELRELQKVQQSYALDEEDQVEISNDITRGFDQRNEALEESFVLQRKKLETERAIADEALKLANAAISVELKKAGISKELSQDELTNLNTNADLRKKVSDEILDAQTKLINEQKAAADKVDDLERQQGERRRQRLEKELSLDIQLLRSKKNSTQLLSEELQKQIDDEKEQIADREVLANKQLENERKITDDIISRIKEVAEAEAKSTGAAIPNIEKENLLLEGNAELLSEKIKLLGLSEGLTLELASAIKKAQEAERKGLENIARLQEEKIKRDQKILQLQKEIELQRTQSTLDAISDLENEKQRQADEANEKILQQENVFNNKKLKQRESLFDATQELEKKQFEAKEDILKQQFELDKDAINRSNEQDEVKFEQRKKLEEKFTQDKEALDRDRATKASENQRKEEEELRKIEIRKTEIVLEELQKVTNALGEELDKRNQKLIEDADRELDKRAEAIDKQTKLAEEGKANQLGFEIAAEEQAQLRKKEIEEKAAREAELVALAQSYQGFLLARLKEADADPNTAPFLALKDTLLARGVAKGLVQFANEGNDWVEAVPGQSAPKGKDSIPFLLAPEEAVIKADVNNKHHDAIVALNSGLFDKLYMPKSDAVKFTDSDVQNYEVLSTLKGIQSEIRNKPVQNWEVDKFGTLVKREIIDHFTKTTRYKPYRKFTD